MPPEFVLQLTASLVTGLALAVLTCWVVRALHSEYLQQEAEWRYDVSRINELRRIRIHCISVGQRSQLLKYLAEDSLGVYREVGLGRRRRNLTNP